jgi:hypothetical protein
MGAAAFPRWIHPRDGYVVYEPVVGCLLAIPWAWLAPATVAAGVALGFEGQYQHFRQHNPALLDRLEKALSFC